MKNDKNEEEKKTQKSIHIIMFLFIAISTLFFIRISTSFNEIMIIPSRRVETESSLVLCNCKKSMKLRFKWIYDCDVRLLDPLTTETNKEKEAKKGWINNLKSLKSAQFREPFNLRSFHPF